MFIDETMKLTHGKHLKTRRFDKRFQIPEYSYLIAVSVCRTRSKATSDGTYDGEKEKNKH